MSKRKGGRRCVREGWTFGSVRRTNVPPVTIGEAEATFFIDGCEVAPSSMIVRLDCSRGGSTRMLKFFCKKNALGYAPLGEEGWFNVVGLYDGLLRLTDQTYVRDWHWDHSTHVIGGSGAGEKPGRAKDNTVVTRVDEYRTYETDGDEQTLVEIELVDRAETDVRHKNSDRKHGCEARDKIEERKRAEKRAEDKAFYGAMGLGVPNE